MIFNGEKLKFDREANCDWCGRKTLVGITHYGTSNYNRLICKKCAEEIKEYNKKYFGIIEDSKYSIKKIITDFDQANITFIKNENRYFLFTEIDNHRVSLGYFPDKNSAEEARKLFNKIGYEEYIKTDTFKKYAETTYENVNKNIENVKYFNQPKTAVKYYKNEKQMKNNTTGVTGVSRVWRRELDEKDYNKLASRALETVKNNDGTYDILLGYQARIKINNKNYNLGTFKTLKEAEEARKLASTNGIDWYLENRYNQVSDPEDYDRDTTTFDAIESIEYNGYTIIEKDGYWKIKKDNKYIPQEFSTENDAIEYIDNIENTIESDNIESNTKTNQLSGIYKYNGPIYKFNTIIKSEFEAETTANNFDKACNNIRSQAKSALGYSQNAKIDIDKSKVIRIK